MGVLIANVVSDKPHLATIYASSTGRFNYPPGKDTLMSVDLFLVGSCGSEDQLSPRNEAEEVRFAFGSALEMGIAAVGIAAEM